MNKILVYTGPCIQAVFSSIHCSIIVMVIDNCGPSFYIGVLVEQHHDLNNTHQLQHF